MKPEYINQVTVEIETGERTEEVVERDENRDYENSVEER